VFALFIGRVEISEANYPALVKLVFDSCKN